MTINKSKYRNLVLLQKAIRIALLLLASTQIISAQQVAVKRIKPSDYEKWYYLNLMGISPNGQWISYQLNYTKGQDTLIVQHSELNRRQVFPGGSKVEFIDSTWAAITTSLGFTQLLDLNSGKIEMIEDVTKIISLQNYLVLFHKKKGMLEMRSLQGKETTELTGITQIWHQHGGTHLVAEIDGASGRSLLLIDLEGHSSQKLITDLEGKQVLELVWQNQAKSLVFTVVENEHSGSTTSWGRLGHYDLNTNITTYLNASIGNKLFKGFRFKRLWQHPLHISQDGKRVSFAIQHNPLIRDPSIPEIWKTSDPYLFNKMEYRQGGRNLPRLGIWEPKTQKVNIITDTLKSNAIFNKGLAKALIYDPLGNKANPETKPGIDLYLMDLSTGQDSLFLADYQESLKGIGFSPEGRYITYTSVNHLWAYDLRTKKSKDLNEAINKYKMKSIDNGETFLVGWSPNDKSMLLKVGFNIWSIPLGDGIPKMIASGREAGISYELLVPERSSKYTIVSELQNFNIRLVTSAYYLQKITAVHRAENRLLDTLVFPKYCHCHRCKLSRLHIPNNLVFLRAIF